MKHCYQKSSSLTLGREKRLRKRRDFLLVQKHGTRAFGKFVVVIRHRPKNLLVGQFGITIPKKIGDAHIRNKIKRRLKHILRMDQALFAQRQIVVIARNPIISASFDELKIDLLESFKRLLLRSPPETASRTPKFIKKVV